MPEGKTGKTKQNKTKNQLRGKGLVSLVFQRAAVSAIFFFSENILNAER